MSSGALRGLLAAALADPFFGSMRAATGAITHRVTGPPSIRPFVAAALAGGFPESDRHPARKPAVCRCCW